MERKRLIRRAALFGGLVLVACGALGTVIALNLEARWQEHVARMERHVAELTEKYQAYLDQTAKKIRGLPVDPKVIGDIQVRHFHERPNVWLYVWASSNRHDFGFGVPSESFERLNKAYDALQEAIARDNFYANRDHFLRTLLHHSRPIAAAEPITAEDGEERRRQRERARENEWWRFHDEEKADWDQQRPNVLFLSSPIQDAAGTTVGNLNLKLVDEADPRVYASRRRFAREDATDVVIPVIVFIGVVSLIWLWFLLPTWVYIDARERDVPRPLLWAVLTLLGSVFALMVYLVTRPTEPPVFRCPQCAKALNGSKAGCPYCGADLAAVFCQQCQYPVKPDWSFCPSCRSPLKRPAGPVAEPA